MGYLREEPLGEHESIFGIIREAFGFVPNFYRAQSLRPDLVRAEAELGNAIIDKESALTRQLKGYIFLVCSAANLSTYCVTIHCEMIRMLGIQGPEPEQIALDHTATNLAVQIKALLNFAKKLNGQPTKISRTDIDALRTFGYTDEQILEAVVLVGYAKFSNYVAFGLGTVPDFDSTKVQAALGAAGGR